MRLADKAAVVTGAAQGIGAAIASRFAAEGAYVACADIRSEGLARTVGAIRAAGGEAGAVVVDIATPEGNQAAVEDAFNARGRLDIFHANAALQLMGRIEATTEETWDRIFNTNLRGVYLGVRAALPKLRASGGGSIIITASVLGIVGDPDLPAYGASKGGLRALCRALAVAHGPENIRVNAICPGDVTTPLLEEFFAFQTDPLASRRAIEAKYPIGRFATPSDIASAALFLASEDAAYITGTDLIIDGGLMASVYR
jgi:NAD(P)-dependent dehydrogenase (short-subunit alcohol dehydrogenase family)